MTVTVVLFDPNAPAGQKFKSAAVRTELAAAAAANLEPGSVGTTLLADESITEPKFADQAVSSRAIAVGGVKATNLDTASVTAPKLASGSVTPSAAGPGIPVARDVSGNALPFKIVTLSKAAYTALAIKDSNTLYLTTP